MTEVLFEMEPVVQVSTEQSTLQPSTVATMRVALALADQGLVSGANFLATILVRRAGGDSELGIYVPSFAILMLAVSVQQSLVCLPYTIFLPRQTGRAANKLAGSVLAHSGFLGLASLIGICLVALGIEWSGGLSALAPVLVAVALATPFVLLREFIRRFEFARLSPGKALLFDLTVSGLHAAGLVMLYTSGWLTALLAHACLGAAAAVAGIFWLFRRRRLFTFDWSAIRSTWLDHVRFGRWVLGAGLLSIANAYLLPWYLLLTLGEVATGTFGSCSTLIDFSNPFVLGLSNVVSPRAAHAYAIGGRRELRSYVARVMLLVFVIMSVFALLIHFFGANAAEFLFNHDFSAQQNVLSLLAIGVVCFALGMPTGEGLSAMERPRLNLLSNIASVSVTFLMALYLVQPYGLVGAGIAIATGFFTSAVLRAMAFLWVTGQREVAT